MTKALRHLIEEKLSLYQWSPEQISGWLSLHGQASISHERIYLHILEDKRQGGTLYQYLRKGIIGNEKSVMVIGKLTRLLVKTTKEPLLP